MIIESCPLTGSVSRDATNGARDELPLSSSRRSSDVSQRQSGFKFDRLIENTR